MSKVKLGLVTSTTCFVSSDLGDDTPKYIFFGYISAKDINKKGSWTNFNITTRPYVWSVPIENLKPIEEFKNER